ncbi:hypothetical protein P7C70_g352, partial [Phenoliferia sp. Uapishka_3]
MSIVHSQFGQYDQTFHNLAQDDHPAGSDEAANARLIAELLAEDLQQATAYHHAEQVQYALVLSDSRPGSPTLPLRPLSPSQFEADDHLAALRFALDGVQSTISVATVSELAELHSKQVADETAARQLSLQFEAAERRERLDQEFARAVQKADTDGFDSDVVGGRGVEGVLGEARVRQMMTAPPQPQVVVQGHFTRAAVPQRMEVDPPALTAAAKGKGRAVSFSPGPPITPVAAAPANNITTCRICLEPCLLTANPFNAALTANSSDRVQFGLYCCQKENEHTYCISCLSGYIQSKIEDTVATTVFPIRCPECTFELSDDLAARVLGQQNLEGWYYRQLLDSTPAVFCPNSRCSARVVPNTDGESQAECPSCHQFMCVECKTQWHNGYNCVQFQALPAESRDPEDFGLLELAKAEGWRRCPACKTVVELESGCYHMTCTCSHHFCYACNGSWNKKKNRCAKNPPCPLWDEKNLIVADPHQAARRQLRDRQHDERERQHPLPRAQLLPAPAHPNRAPQAAHVQPNRFQYDLNRQALIQEEMMQRMQELEEEQDEQERRRAQQVEEDEEEWREQNHRQHYVQHDEHQYGDQQQRHHGHYVAETMQRLDWMNNVAEVSLTIFVLPGRTVHPFTADFLQRRCGYCDVNFNTIRDLQQHLATTQQHRVFTCCGKFFRVQAHLDQHLDSRSPVQHDPFQT